MTDRDADARVARRLASRHGPRTWTGVCVRIVPAARHESADAVFHTPDHYLAAAWAPADRGPARWPEAVVIGSPSATRTLDALLRHLPDDAMLLLADLDDVDAALAAEILLASDSNLEAYQRDAIAGFVRSEHSRTRAAIASRYTDTDAGFERFRARVLGRH